VLERRPATEKRSPQIHIHHFVESLRRRLGDSPAAENAGIVDGNVHAAVLLHGSVKEHVGLIFMADVRLNDEGLPAFPANFLGRLLAKPLPSSGHDDLGSFLAKAKSNGFADSTAAAGDNSHFTRETLHLLTYSRETSGFL
jgi:hypothetical protein